MTESVSKYIAITSDVKTAGASVWWRLKGDFHRGALRHFLVEEGLDSEEWLPKEPKEERCFSRAVKALYKDKHHNVESLPDGGGYAVVKKTKSKTSVDHDTEFTLKLENGSVVAGGDGFAPVGELLDTTEKTNYFRTRVISDDVSAWLIDCAERLGAVSLRERGGIYFIPNKSLVIWRKLVSALVKASNGAHTVYSLSTLHEDDAVAAILDALTAEAEEFFSSCSEKIEKGTIGGKRAISNRRDDADKLLAKIKSYEKLLGKSLETLTEACAETELELAAALLAAEEAGNEVKLAL